MKIGTFLFIYSLINVHLPVHWCTGVIKWYYICLLMVKQSLVFNNFIV